MHRACDSPATEFSVDNTRQAPVGGASFKCCFNDVARLNYFFTNYWLCLVHCVRYQKNLCKSSGWITVNRSYLAAPLLPTSI